MLPPSAKRFKPSVVDLTLTDSDSDDDIFITGVRQVGEVPPVGAKIADGVKAATMVDGFVRQPQPPQPHRARQLPTPTNSSPSNVENLTGLEPTPAVVADLPVIKRPSATTRPKARPQVVKQDPVMLKTERVTAKMDAGGLLGLTVHPTGAIEYQGCFFNSMQDIRKRRIELQERLSKYQRGIEALELKEKTRPAKLMEIKRKRDQLLKLGTATDNPRVIQLEKELAGQSNSLKDSYQRKKEFQAGLRRSQKKYQLFTNSAQPVIEKFVQEKLDRDRERLRIIREQEERRKEQELNAKLAAIPTPLYPQRHNAQLTAEQRLQRVTELAAIQRQEQQLYQHQQQLLQQRHQQQLLQQQHQQQQPGIFNRALNIAGNVARAGADVVNGIMGGYDDEEEDYTAMVQEEMRRIRERHQLVHNPMGLNAYNTDDLVHLLESVKKQEEQEVEGESNTPADLTVNLLKHQRRGLKWLEDTENDDKKRGGILADAMGLGKTVQLISLMLSNRAKEPENDEEEEELDEDSPEGKKAPYGRTNLIVAPVSLINQWKGELESKVKDSAEIKIFMYHSLGSRRVSFEQLKKYDVVMTSYGTLASELKKHCSFPGAGDESELNTTFNLGMLNKKKENNGYVSPFYSSESKFYRIVLDESQQIKNKATKVSIATATLEGFYRWCLSGTPMQNNVNELYPLLRFLRIRPYNDFSRFKNEISGPLELKAKDTDEEYLESAVNKLRILLRSVMLRREKDSKIDGKPILDLPEKSIVREDIKFDSNENEHKFYTSIEERSKDRFVQMMNDSRTARGNYSAIFTMLLRLRQACLHSELVRIGDRRAGIRYDADGNVLSTANVESMCKNASKLKPNVVSRINEQSESDSGFDCPICLESNLEAEGYTLFTPCGHGICKECVESFFETFQENSAANGVRVAKCTACRLAVKENEVVDFDVFDKHVNKNQSVEMIRIVYEQRIKEQKKADEMLKETKLEYSPKIRGCIELLEKIWEKDPNDKVIIFSHFTSFFTILQKFLGERQIHPLQYLGSMNISSRNEVVKDFYRNDESKLMLISLKAGNSGLTLTCANHVIIMDPFWNPYVEAQAQDRCHRIGQAKPVKVYRMLMKDTVEDRILDLQDRKQRLIESAMDPTGMKNASRLSREDIATLFGVRLARR